MKTLSLIVSILICTSVYSQSDSSLMFREVVKMDSLSKKEIGLQVREWFHNTFKNTKNVVDVNDLENGQFLGMGSFSYVEYIKVMGIKTPIYGSVRYKINIEVKDGKYRFEIGPFMVDDEEKGTNYVPDYVLTTSNVHPSTLKANYGGKKFKESLNELWNNMKKRAENEASILSSSLKASVKSTKTSNDW